MRTKNTTQIKVLSPARRIAVAVGAAVVVMLAAGLIYIFVIVRATSGNPVKPINGNAAFRIVAASKAYANALHSRGLPVPASVPVSELVRPGLLEARDVIAFEGLDASIVLKTNGAVYLPQTVLMRVRMGDGSDVVLYADGSVQTGHIIDRPPAPRPVPSH